MNRLLRISMIAVLLFTLCFSCLAVFAVENSTSFAFSADCVKTVNAGETFDVTVKASRNNGIIALRFFVEYDEDILMLNSVTDEKLFEGAVVKDYYASPYQYVWIGGSTAEDSYATGDIITLSFTAKQNISDDVSAYISITTDSNDILNSDLTSVPADRLDVCIDIIAGDQAMTGDVDGDGSLTTADAVYLMYYTLNGEVEYPLNQSGDFDGNGTVDSDDAVYLLYHVLFSEEYPLNN